MRSFSLNGPIERSWMLVFKAGDRFSSELDLFARRAEVSGAHFTAIGGFQRATLGYFLVDERRYQDIDIDEQVEVLSLIGDIATLDGVPKIHAHAVVGTRTGETRGGHLQEAVVRPTLEVVLTETPAHLRRTFVPEFGIALIDPDAAGDPSGRS